MNMFNMLLTHFFRDYIPLRITFIMIAQHQFLQFGKVIKVHKNIRDFFDEMKMFTVYFSSRAWKEINQMENASEHTVRKITQDSLIYWDSVLQY
jgi:hypothetical protein